MSRWTWFISLLTALVLGLVALYLLNYWSSLTLFFDRPRTLAELNRPPKVDSQCIERLSAEPEVLLRKSPSYVAKDKCVIENAVYVDRLAGLRFDPPGPLMRCEVADSLHRWLEKDVKRYALDILEREITVVEHLGTFNCRSIRTHKGILSQHGFANAIDIAAFTFNDGTRQVLEQDWNSTRYPRVATFWKKIHRSSCKFFGVSLGPDYDEAHSDHFHLDLGPLRSCR